MNKSEVVTKVVSNIAAIKNKFQQLPSLQHELGQSGKINQTQLHDSHTLRTQMHTRTHKRCQAGRASVQDTVLDKHERARARARAWGTSQRILSC